MAAKGLIEEIFSKAQYADEPKNYKIIYRDYESLREMTLVDFLNESKNFQKIPSSRIRIIKKNNKILFKKKLGEM